MTTSSCDAVRLSALRPPCQRRGGALEGGPRADHDDVHWDRCQIRRHPAFRLERGTEGAGGEGIDHPGGDAAADVDAAAGAEEQGGVAGEAAEPDGEAL